MGIPRDLLLSDNFLRCLTPEQRKQSGLPKLFSEILTERQPKLEIKELHQPFIQWLRLNEVPFLYSNPRKKTTIRVGWPDFSVFKNGRTAFVEFKRPGGVISTDQEKVISELSDGGFPVIVSTSLGEAIFLVRAALQLHDAAAQ